jgi:hypothetical protein
MAEMAVSLIWVSNRMIDTDTHSICWNRDREATLRLGYGAAFFEGMGCALWGIESSLLFLEAADSPLPCHDPLWVRLLAHLNPF